MDKSLVIQLKQNAHHLKPVIMIGQKGITDALILETDKALTTHECIKIKISGWEKEDKASFLQTLCAQTQSTLIDSIGHTAVIYRKKPEDKKKKSN